MPQIPPGYALASYRYDHSGYARPAYTVFGVFNDLSHEPDVLAQLIAGAWASPSLQAQMDSNVSLTETRVLVGQDGGDPLIGVYNVPAAGASSRTSTSPGVALLARKVTALGGRRNRGAAFLPWIASQTAIGETGQVASTTLTAVQGCVNAWLEELDTQGCPMVILHSLGSSAIPDPTPVTAMTVSGVVSRQGRRQLR